MSFGQRIDEAEVRLREWLESEVPKPGVRLPSERILSVQLGLQHYALNRAMGRLIVKGHVRREGYKLFSTGSLQSPPVFACHLIISQHSTHLPGYLTVAKEMGIKLILHPWLTINEPIGILEKLEVGEAEGVIFDAPYVLTDSNLAPITARFRKRSIPIICMGQPASGLFSVLTDITQSLQLALDHLLEQGHREIGLITSPPTTPMFAEILQAWDYLCYKHELTTSAGRVHLQASIRLEDEIAAASDVITQKWRTATAVIVFSARDCNIQLLRDHLGHHGRRVPDSLSLLLIGNAKTSTATTSSVSSVSFDIGAVQETAFNLLQRVVRKKSVMGILPPPYSLRIQSQLLLRKSTKPPHSIQARATDSASGSVRPAPVQPEALREPEETPKSLEAHLRNAYSLAARGSLSERSRFVQIDLGSFVNRPLKFRRGWLGDLPLKHFLPGMHEIHGVPFNILGGASRSECGALVFHSAVNVTARTKKLPSRLTIPIGVKTRAVYILHGCGYAKFLQTFAHYEFHNRKTCIESVPLVSLGHPSPDYSPDARGANNPVPNIQDWWSDFPHTDFPGARMAPILENDTPGTPPRHVFLYTLEWINPKPDTLVSHLEISVNPELATTLGVLAITVLKP
jgi:DNA-binding LacI/PurR family transcriptional regulator